MDISKVLENLPPEIDRRLTELLSDWSTAYGLDSAQAEVIRREILFAVEELPAGWWAEYCQRLNATFAKATQVHKSIVASLQLQQLHRLSPQIGWTPANAAQWQPYLKIT